MTKERLEEIRKRTLIHVHLEKDSTAEMPRVDMEYLQGQAERVEELERRNSDFWLENDTLHKSVEYLHDQNKRYREVLDRISNHDVYKIDITAAGKMADRALVGDSDEH